MKPIRILGIGSIFGADQIGLLVTKQIKDKIFHHPIHNIIDVEYYDRPGFQLIELVKNAKEIHIIDAMVTGSEAAGFIHRYTDITLFKSLDNTFSSHGYGVAEVLQLAKSMNYLPEKLIIHGIEMGEENILTPKLVEACDKLANNVVNEVLQNVEPSLNLSGKDE